MSELLKNIRVASPCSVDWNTMTGDERIRYCGQCNLNVYNLSAMSEREIHKLISDQKGRMCVRFYRRKDGTVLTQNCPVGLKHAMQRISRVAGVIFSALVSTFSFAAQRTSKQVQTVNQESSLDLLVLDASGAICPKAAVQLTGKDFYITGTTDDQGKFHLVHLAPGSYSIAVKLPGFRDQKQTAVLRPDKNSSLRIVLEIQEQQGAVYTVEAIPIEQVESPTNMKIDPVPVPPKIP